jgi:hypothetical protein
MLMISTHKPTHHRLGLWIPSVVLCLVGLSVVVAWSLGNGHPIEPDDRPRQDATQPLSTSYSIPNDGIDYFDTHASPSIADLKDRYEEEVRWMDYLDRSLAQHIECKPQRRQELVGWISKVVQHSSDLLHIRFALEKAQDSSDRGKAEQFQQSLREAYNMWYRFKPSRCRLTRDIVQHVFGTDMPFVLDKYAPEPDAKPEPNLPDKK